MIEDEELRNLFKIESDEHLQRLDDGLLRLEKTPDDAALIEEMFREAHSLKGAARMLGLTDIMNRAHGMEDTIGAAKRGETALTPEILDGMYQGLNAIRDLVSAECGMRIAELKPDTAPTPQSALRTPQSTAPQPEITTELFRTPNSAFRIDVVRVEPQKLDALMTQAGELTVTKLRIARRLTEIDGLLDYCEEWARAARGASADVMEGLEQLNTTLNRIRSGAYEDSSRLDYIAGQLEDGIRAIRLLPLSTVFSLFPRLVHDLAREQAKEVDLIIEGGETAADKRILEEMKDPLMHILRNAIDHGIETPERREQAGKPRGGTIRLKAFQTATHVVIEVGDDGRGLDLEAIGRSALKRGLVSEAELAAMSEAQVQSLIFASGLSTSSFVTDVSGRGVGLDVVRTNVERLKGTVQIESAPGKGMLLRAQLPITLATARVLTVAVNGRSYALPVEYVHTSRMMKPGELFTIEGRTTIMLEGQAVSIARLSDLLEIPTNAELGMRNISNSEFGMRNISNSEFGMRNAESPATPHSALRIPQSALERSALRTPQSPIVFLSVGDERFGLIADELIDEQEVVLKPQSAILRRVRNVSGATILETGEVCTVLNPHDLLKSLRKQAAPIAAAPPEAVAAKKVLLLAEDSIVTRTQEKRILESAGYEVVTAVDGLDAFNKLGARAFDGVVSDIVMPNLDGLALTAKIREDKKYAELPVVLVTTLSSDEDKRRGLEAGANAYITKPAFDQQVLLDCLKRLI